MLAFALCILMSAPAAYIAFGFLAYEECLNDPRGAAGSSYSMRGTECVVGSHDGEITYTSQYAVAARSAALGLLVLGVFVMAMAALLPRSRLDAFTWSERRVLLLGALILVLTGPVGYFTVRTPTYHDCARDPRGLLLMVPALHGHRCLGLTAAELTVLPPAKSVMHLSNDALTVAATVSPVAAMWLRRRSFGNHQQRRQPSQGD